MQVRSTRKSTLKSASSNVERFSNLLRVPRVELPKYVLLLPVLVKLSEEVGQDYLGAATTLIARTHIVAQPPMVKSSRPCSPMWIVSCACQISEWTPNFARKICLPFKVPIEVRAFPKAHVWTKGTATFRPASHELRLGMIMCS